MRTRVNEPGTPLRRLRGRVSSSCRPTPPDFNPIELAFAKVKEHLRAAAERTPAGLFAATAAAIDVGEGSKVGNGPGGMPPGPFSVFAADRANARE